MSIIIGIISRDNQLYLGADKRAILQNGIMTDNYDKIYMIRQNLYFGMTGIAEYGLSIKDRLLKLPNISKMPIKEVLGFLDSIYNEVSLASTILLSGRFEDNRAFIWNKNTLGKKNLIEFNSQDIVYSINSNSNTDLFEKRFIQEVQVTKYDYFKAIINTIDYASTIDNSISKVCNIVKL